jgi:hypothetical protein
MKKELIEDKTMLKDAVSQLVSYHQDVEAILCVFIRRLTP